jgi:hypothetical protein
MPWAGGSLYRFVLDLGASPGAARVDWPRTGRFEERRTGRLARACTKFSGSLPIVIRISICGLFMRRLSLRLTPIAWLSMRWSLGALRVRCEQSSDVLTAGFKSREGNASAAFRVIQPPSEVVICTSFVNSTLSVRRFWAPCTALKPRCRRKFPVRPYYLLFPGSVL